MGKRLQKIWRCTEIGNRWCDPKLLLSGEEAKLVLGEMGHDERHKALAMMSIFMPVSRVAEISGVSFPTVLRARKKYSDIVKATTIAHANVMLARLCESKAGEVAASINASKIPDEKKGQTVKALMDSADIAHQQAAPKVRDEEKDTMELVFRVKKYMRNRDQPKEVEGKVVEGEYEEVSDDERRNGK